ncbi:TIM-barrel domain-containing protein [Lacticaseibacillus parakribbianus]|uniref:glycoside hydrolase family 31 protein n=1 Tax=Lacticaseibacillus parakribbianus TaxID=2970927 RepID=UPI0021CB783E|nr:TIM-barrel domain-containing protein [Lacticaseibacillus parakribbianus]
MSEVLNYDAKTQSVTVGATTVQLVTPAVIRVTRGAVQAAGTGVVTATPQPVDVNVAQQAASLTLTTAAMQVQVAADGHVDVLTPAGAPLVCDYRQPRRPLLRDISAATQALVEAEGHTVQATGEQAPVEIVKRMPAEAHFYGLGDKTGFLDKRGYAYDNWNTDQPEQIEETKALYKSVPFVIGHTPSGAFGLFLDNSYKSHFDLGMESPDYFFVTAAGGALDYYLIAGTTPAAVLTTYTGLTGRTPLPQKWTLGYQQSRFSYPDAPTVRAIVSEFAQKRLPLDAIHLDIDYMDGYRVFTVDSHKFPDLKALTAGLSQQGVKVVTIIDPGVKAEPGYRVYEEGLRQRLFATTAAGATYLNTVWPGKAAYPDFGQAATRRWWGCNQQFLVDHGVSGVWNDMNEPAGFDGPMPADTVFHNEEAPATIQRMHNLYGHNMAKATYDGLKTLTKRRPFVISRAVFAGTQRYSTVWTGDNRSSWEHLRMMIPQLCNLGMSGFGFAGTDIGGFLGDTTAELLTRWVEAAVFSPLFRNHSCAGTRMQEPWRFGEPTLAIYRRYLELRYRLLDYLYDLFEAGTRTGLPVMRPLVLNYPADAAVANLNTEFMVGDALLVAPILSPGVHARLVYLPAGDWFDYWTGDAVAGGRTVVVAADLATLPLFVKGGTVLPLRPATLHVDVPREHALTFKLWGQQGTYRHYQDDGESFAYENGAYNRYEVAVTADQATVTLSHRSPEVPVYARLTIETARGSYVLVFDDATGAYRMEE